MGEPPNRGCCSPRAKTVRIIFKEQETLPLNPLYRHLKFYFNFLNNDDHWFTFFLDVYHQTTFPQTLSNWAQSMREELIAMTSLTDSEEDMTQTIGFTTQRWSASKSSIPPNCLW